MIFSARKRQPKPDLAQHMMLGLPPFAAEQSLGPPRLGSRYRARAIIGALRLQSRFGAHHGRHHQRPAISCALEGGRMKLLSTIGAATSLCAAHSVVLGSGGALQP